MFAKYKYPLYRSVNYEDSICIYTYNIILNEQNKLMKNNFVTGHIKSLNII